VSNPTESEIKSLFSNYQNVAPNQQYLTDPQYKAFIPKAVKREFPNPLSEILEESLPKGKINLMSSKNTDS